MEFEVQELEEDDKPVEKPQKRLLEDPIHKGSTLPGFHISKEPPTKKPWYCMSVVCLPCQRSHFSAILTQWEF